MSKPRLNRRQFNVKQTESEYKTLQEVNQKYFNGSLNNSDLGRFLLKLALQTLKDAKVEIQLTVNGKTIDTNVKYIDR